MADDDMLNRNQQKAIAALIESRTVAGAAEIVGISERTLYRYLEEPGFRKVLTQAESGLINNAGFRLLAGQEQALDTLERLMLKARSEHVRMNSARAWLDYSFRYRELKNIEERLAEVERKLDGKVR